LKGWVGGGERVRSSRCKFGAVWGGEGIGIVRRDSGEGWWRGMVE